MKSIGLLVISFVISIAMAQDANQNESKSSPNAGAQTQSAKLGQSAQSYKGTLVDASCMSSTGTAPASNNASDVPKQSPKEQNTEVNRSTSAANAGQSCAVSASTNQFALKLDDGRTVPFDSVGNLRVQQALKDKKKWNEAIGSGKPIRAKVSGFMADDKLMVISIS